MSELSAAERTLVIMALRRWPLLSAQRRLPGESIEDRYGRWLRSQIGPLLARLCDEDEAERGLVPESFDGMIAALEKPGPAPWETPAKT